MKILRRMPVVYFILAPFSLAHASGLEAGSWGGKVRAGPGKNYDQIGSLQNGDPVVLLKCFDVASSEYPWFELTFKGGQVEYQWGGILCAFESAIEGVYKQCEKDNRPLYPDYLLARKKQVYDQKIANVKRKLNLLPTDLETRTGLRAIGLIMMVNARNIKL